MRPWQSIALSFVLLVAGCGDDRPPRFVERRPFAGEAQRSPALLKAAMIDGHARARAAAGVAPLTWDDALAADARAYAREMARTGRFRHSPEPRGAPHQGENLWTGTRRAYRYDEMVGHWVAEAKDYVDAPTPDFSRTGRPGDVSHYTQIVWSTTRRFGCAEASNARDDFVACRYLPAGNVVGERALP